MEKPILFSTDMVQALLAGRKTMTRRIVDPQPENTNAKGKKVIKVADWFTGLPDRGPAYYWKDNGCWNSSKPFKYKYGKDGDILWVREKFAKRCTPNGDWSPKLGYCYCADNDPLNQHKKWKPSIHMPKDACRIFLQITNVRVERLKDITEEDAIAEGVEKQFSHLFQEWRYKDYAKVKDDWRSPISSFQSLWASLNGFDSWDENPWVWVIEFKRINKPSHV